MTLPTQNPIPSSTKNDQLFNAEKIDQVVNSDDLQYTDRFGKKRFTFAGIYNVVQNWMESLKSPSGASGIGLIQKGYVQQAITYVTPEMFGAAGDGITDDTQAFIDMLASGYLRCEINKNYVISDNILIPPYVTLVINGTITQKSSGVYSWTSSNRSSTYPMFLVTSKNVRIEGTGTLINQYEAIKVDVGGDNLTVDGLKISNPDRSLSVGISVYNVSNTTINNCYIANNGIKGTYNLSTSQQIYGWGNGIDFGAVRGMKITDCYFYNNGQCGAWCYGASNVIFTGNICNFNYQSGIQYGPHANYNGLVVANNTFTTNGADGIDINNTGSSTIDIRATISGNVSILNGYFEGDITKPTQDGSGIATLRLVSGITCTGNYSLNCAGVGVYLTQFSYATISDNIIINSITSSSGIYMGGSGADLTIHDNIVFTKGSSLQIGGSTSITRMKFHDNTLISTNAASVSLPSNTYTDIAWHDNMHSSASTINFWFSAFNEKIRFTGTTGNGVYINTSYGLFRLDVNGSTTGSLVYMDGGVKNRMVAPNVNNTGTGTGLTLNASNYTTMHGPFVQCAAGVGLSVVGGGNTSLYDPTLVGVTAVSATSAITYTGIKTINGATAYTVKPFNCSYVQET